MTIFLKTLVLLLFYLSSNIVCTATDDTCTINCNAEAACGVSNGDYNSGPEIHCPTTSSCTTCNINCQQKQACSASTIYGHECSTLNINVEDKDHQKLTIYAPNEGSLNMSVTTGNGKLETSYFYAGIDTKDIFISCLTGRKFKENMINASSITGILTFESSGDCKSDDSSFVCPIDTQCLIDCSGDDCKSMVIESSMGTRTLSFICGFGVDCSGTILNCDYNSNGDTDCSMTNCTGPCVNPPTYAPTMNPTNIPSITPTNSPSFNPTNNPSFIPTINPLFYPTNSPSFNPTNNPSFIPTINPLFYPTNSPSFYPTKNPLFYPKIYPSFTPTKIPANKPRSTYIPTNAPSNIASIISPSNSAHNPITSTQVPTYYPTTIPSVNQYLNPTQVPTDNPSMVLTSDNFQSTAETANKLWHSHVHDNNNAFVIVLVSVLIFMCIFLSILIFYGYYKYRKLKIESILELQRIKLEMKEMSVSPNNIKKHKLENKILSLSTNFVDGGMNSDGEEELNNIPNLIMYNTAEGIPISSQSVIA